jgi:hypothetical protein
MLFGGIHVLKLTIKVVGFKDSIDNCGALLLKRNNYGVIAKLS